MGDRDKNVGIRVKFPTVEKDKIVYQFLDDPFPGLNGKVNAEDLVDTYINFKIKTILGEAWNYKITKHFWNGDKYTEIEIIR